MKNLDEVARELVRQAAELRREGKLSKDGELGHAAEHLDCAAEAIDRVLAARDAHERRRAEEYLRATNC